MNLYGTFFEKKTHFKTHFKEDKLVFNSIGGYLATSGKMSVVETQMKRDNQDHKFLEVSSSLVTFERAAL